MTIRSTYALDPETVRALEEMARELGVSRSEALRRAVRLAAGQVAGTPLETLDALQGEARLSGRAASAWAARSRAERRASSTRRERMVR